RQTVRRSDAQTRWDQAYQHLLQWMGNREGATCLPHPSHLRARNRRWSGKDGLKPAHVSPHALKGGGLQWAKALFCQKQTSPHATKARIYDDFFDRLSSTKLCTEGLTALSVR